MRFREHIVARHARGAGAGGHVARQHAHDCRLARPIWAEQSHDLPSFDLKRNGVHCHVADITLRQVLDLNHQPVAHPSNLILGQTTPVGPTKSDEQSSA